MKLLKTKELAEFTKMVGANLRYIRIARKLSQTKVSHALDVTFQQMQKYEAGTNCINAWRLVQLSNFFKVPVSDILNVDYIANSCNKKTPQDAGYLKPQNGIGSMEEITKDQMDAALDKAKAEGLLEPKVIVGSLEKIKDQLKKDGIDPEETILPALRNEKAKRDLKRRTFGNLSFDASRYEEFEDEYPAPLSQLEHDPKMRATYDAIIDGRKRRH
jgi:transcriptional regulator with XRE-family HTH domain